MGRDGSEFDEAVSGSEAAVHDSRTDPPERASVAVARPAKLGGTESTGVVGVAVRRMVFVSPFPEASTARTTKSYARLSVRSMTTMLRSVVESSGEEKSIGLPLRFMKTQ